jgi:PAS domain S-box-containing protein
VIINPYFSGGIGFRYMDIPKLTTQTELEMIRSRDLREAVFNESADALFLVDTETLLTIDCNARAVELFEVSSKAELIGIEGHTLQKKQFTPEELVSITETINQHGFWSREIEYVTKQGNSFWGNLAAKRIIVAGQSLNLVRVTDITQRKEAEQLLELQAVITRNMAEGICLIRAADGVIVYANPKFYQMFGYETDELINQHVSVVNYEDEPASAQAVSEAITAAVMEKGEATYEVHNVKKDGTPFWCSATTCVFEHPEHGTVLVAVQQDITEHKEAEEKIKASLKEKEVLLKEIHHRVKNNLGIVNSLLQMQCRRIQGSEASAILRDSQNRIASIALVHEKLYSSENLANIDFAQYIIDLVTYLCASYQVDYHQIKLSFQVECNLELDIETAIPCGLIINELISNAVKYAFPDERQGEIKVKFYQKSKVLIKKPTQDTFALIIQDNGVGLPKGFEPKTAKTLGMKLVQGLVQQLKGTLEINRNQGTEFVITFTKVRK